MARLEEVPFLLMQTSYVYQVCWANQQPTAMHHVQDLAEQGLVNPDSITNSHESVLQRRQSFSDTLKLYFDQLDYYSAMHEIFMGLRRFTQACQLIGVIKPLPYGSEKLIYENRFKAFESIQVPRYVEYEAYKEQTEKENAEEGAFESLLDEAKAQLTKGAQRLGALAAVSEDARLCEVIPTATL